MKKVILLCVLFIFCVTHSNAQFFKNAFDRQFLVTDPTSNGTSIFSGLTSYSAPNYNLEIGNGQGTYQSLTGPVMQGLIRMYKGTNQKSYLRDFVRISYNVQEHRDDKMQGSNQGDPFTILASQSQSECTSLNFTPNSSISRPVAATWSMYRCTGESLVWYASAVYSGEIIFPMAEFVHLIKVEMPILANTSCSLSNFNTWGDYADWLDLRIVETIKAHTEGWFTYNSGDYRRDVYKTINLGIFNNPHTAFFHGLLNESFVFHNFSTAMARAYAVIYDYTSDNMLKDDLQDYLIQMKENWIEYASLENEADGFIWAHGQKKNGDDCTEELSHGAFAVQMALLCNEYGIEDSSGNLLYDLSFIKKLVNTFIRNAYHQPLNIGPGVDGTFVCNADCYNNNCAYFSEKQLRGSGAWMPLSSTNVPYLSYEDYIDMDIYNILMDVNLLHAEDIWPAGAVKTGTPPLNYSYMAMYYKKNKEILDPITALRTPGNGSQWAGADVGDITGNGIEEIVAVRNYAEGHKVFAFNVVQDPTYSYLSKIEPVTSTNPGNLQFADVAVGDLDPSHEGDEIITATNLNAHLIMYSHNGTAIAQQASYTLASQYSEWKGVAVGDFIKGNGKEEFVAVRNLDGKFYMFEYNPSSGQFQGVTNWGDQSNYNWSRIDVGDIDGDGYEDDIVAMNNATGHILTYYYDDSSNTMIPGAKYTLAGSSSNWTDVAIGNFCRHNQDKVDIMVRRALDGEMTIFREQNGQLVRQKTSFFTGGQKMEILGAGNFNLPNNKDELVALRNIDGDIFTFNVGTTCSITALPEKRSFNASKQHNENRFLAVPNPNSGHFRLSNLDANSQIEIFDSSGNPVPFIRNGENIDISKQSNGLYFCRIINNGVFTNMKIVKH